MSFTIGSTTFSGRHGKANPSPFNAPSVQTSFAGARGVLELQDPIKDRTIMIPYLVSASSVANLNAALESLHIQSGQITGTLTIDSTTYRNCKFMAFVPEGRVFPDAVSSTWKQNGKIIVHQLNYYAVS